MACYAKFRFGVEILDLLILNMWDGCQCQRSRIDLRLAFGGVWDVIWDYADRTRGEIKYTGDGIYESTFRYLRSNSLEWSIIDRNR